MKKVLKEIPKRKNVMICIGLGDLEGYEYGEIRQYIKKRDGSYQPTTKGFTFPPELLKEIIDGLEELKKNFMEGI